jgi:DNA-binding Lrp family transcriptional regulator
VLECYAQLVEESLISRIGVVFAPNTVGVSTLAAMRVPAGRLQEAAGIVNAQPETNHNYAREHRWNLWFVLTAPNRIALDAAIARIERATGLPVLGLPLLEEYHIDLGFDLDAGSGAQKPRSAAPVSGEAYLTVQDRRILAAVQSGLPLEPRPWAAVARHAGCSEADVLGTLEGWLDGGVARRIGVVVKHRSLGYVANAMVVWDVADAALPRVAQALAAHPEVTLCYRRPRHGKGWPYNLFCMFHGRDRDAVLATLAALRQRPDFSDIPCEVLFSTRCFRQRGARYARAA